MFKNYMIVAFRNFSRNKIFSLINIAGLAIGISAALVIYLIVHYEFSYEKYQKDGSQIYRIVTNMHFPNGQDFKNSGVPGPLPQAVRTEIPGIEKSTQFWNEGAMKVSIPANSENQKRLGYQEDIVFVDDQYFHFFDYKWLVGSPDRALTEPNQVVLSESRAKIYFPGLDVRNVLDQNINYNDSVHATVVGVVKDIDEVTDFTFKDFISLSTISEKLKASIEWDKWGNVNSSSQFFVKLKKKIDTARINKQLAAVRMRLEKNTYLATEHFLQPLNDIHFNPDFESFHHKGHRPTLYGLLAVAVFLLILGCINFINLTTAQATQRAKEIGIRKTVGGSKAQLVFQFLSETVFLTTTAAVVSLLLTPWLLQVFSAYIPPNLKLDILHQTDVFIFIVALILVVSILSGFYPALILSGFKPVLVLKNLAYANTAQSRKAWLRKTLTVTQFVIAQFFIIATMVFGKQIRFSLNKDMGFKKDAIIDFHVPFNFNNPDNKQFVLQDKLKSIPGIQKMSLAGFPPAHSGVNMATLKTYDKSGKEVETTVQMGLADTAYFDLYKIKLVAGRNLEQSDTLKEYLVNENYAKLLGYLNTSEIIGKQIKQARRTATVVGVLPDIHTRSLHEAIQPLAYSCESKVHSFFHIALPGGNDNTDNWKKTIASIGTAFKQVYPDEPFEYEFIDESIAKFYKREQDTVNLLNWCTGLAIFISCLGLLGLVIFTTAQRTKEIGVRKVLGASVAQIVSLLSKDFILLVLIAFLIATPIAWWTMYNWLQDFAYRTSISWWIFGLSGLAMIIVALLTLSIKTIRSALANPVKSLRTE